MSASLGQPNVFGSYVLLKALGEGGSGQIFLAHPLSRAEGVPKLVVIKRLRESVLSDEQYLARFKHEAEMAVRLESPYIANAFELGAAGGEPYIALEHIAGRSLASVIMRLATQRRYLSLGQAIALIDGAVRGLDDLHRAVDPDTREPLNIVHRDIAPKNLMIDSDHQMRIIDLGIGRSVIQEVETGTGIVLGSPGYMSPEQVTGKALDARSDLYALALVLFEMLTLRRYIPVGSVLEVLRASVRPPFIRPSSLRPDLPLAFDRLMERALAPDPRHRYANAGELLDALYELRGTGETQVGPLLEELYQGSFVPNERDALAELERVLAEMTPVIEPTTLFARRTGDAGSTMLAGVPSTITVRRPMIGEPPAQATMRVPLVAVAIAFSLVSAAGLYVLLAGRPRRVEANVPAVEASQQPQPTGPRAARREGAVAKEAAPLIEEKEPAKKTRAKARTPEPELEARPKPVQEQPPEPKQKNRAVTEEDVRRTAEALTKRVLELRAKPNAPAELNSILGDISLEAQLQDPPRAMQRLSAIERRIDALDR